MPRPSQVWVPMVQHDGPSARIVVEVEQQVRQGELLGRADAPGSLNVHAPLAGRVAALGRIDTARAVDVPAVHVVAAGPRDEGRAEADLIVAVREPGAATGPAPTREAGAATEPAACSADRLARLADEAGLTVFHDPALALGSQLREAAALQADQLIINGLPRGPVFPASGLTLAESMEAILRASAWIHHALGVERTWLVVDASDRRQRARVRAAAAGLPIQIVGLRNRYPSAAPVLLAKAVLGRETPPGGSTLAVGCLVLEVDAVAALWSAATRGRPFVDRVVRVVGSAVRSPGCYRIPIGTCFADVLRYVGLRRPVAQVIDGGPMTGRAVSSLDVVVTKQTSAIVLLQQHEVYTPRPGPCVRCGWCQEDCPVGLDPQALLDLIERDRPELAGRLHPHACLECGLCSYVCPAELPLAEAVVRLKQLTAATHARNTCAGSPAGP